MLVLGPGISLLPRLLMLGGDDVVAIDRSPVAVAFGRENKLHRSQVEWFFSTLDEGRELAPVRGAVAWEVGDARDANAALGPFEHVVATALLHGFGDEQRRRIVANAAAWLGAGGVFHVGLYGGSQVAAKLEADAASAGLALDDASEGRRLRLWCFGSG